MNDVDCWIYFDGPEPALVRPILDALRTPPPVAPEDVDRILRAVLEKIDGTLSPASCPALPGPAPAPPIDVERRHLLRVLEEAPAPPDVAPPPAPAPASKRPPAALASTALGPHRSAAEWEARGKLPFVPAPPPGTAAPVQRAAAKTMPVRIVPADLRETFPLGTEAPWKPIAALPFAGSPEGDGLVRFPSLTVEQYVSLRADLEASPAHTLTIRLQYRVPTDASFRALVEHWQAQLTARPELRAQADAAAATYMSWLRATSR